jgi:fluoride exporter
MWKSLLLVFIGGGLGSGLRFLVSYAFKQQGVIGFPKATFLVNILGCLLIGLLIGVLAKQQELPNEYKLLWITGFCGGFTTFSAFGWENLQLIQQHQYTIAIVYTLLSIVLGIAAVFAGLILTR